MALGDEGESHQECLRCMEKILFNDVNIMNGTNQKSTKELRKKITCSLMESIFFDRNFC